MAPIEVLAAVQYLSTAHWARNFFQASAAAGSAGGTLHGWGYLAAAIMLLLFVIINIVGIRCFAQDQQRDHQLEGAIPVVTILVLLIGHFHASNFGARRRRLLRPGTERSRRSCYAAGRDHLLAAGLRAGGAARRRGEEPGS